MITQQELEGHWNEVKGRLRERWGELTDNELQQAHGNATQLVGVIERKTGESRRAIEDFLEEMLSDGANTFQHAAETAREYADMANEAIRDQFEHVSQSVRSGYEQTEAVVRTRPIESVAVAFGAGIITGVVVGLVLKSR